MGQALSARHADNDKSPTEGKRKVHNTSPHVKSPTPLRQRHWAIYKDYFADSYHSPPRHAPERKTSIFHYYKKEKEIYPELRLSPKRPVGEIRPRPVHEYIPRKKFDEMEEGIQDEKNTHNMKDLLLMYQVASEKNETMREEMFLSIPPPNENILKITTNSNYLKECKELLHETELQLRMADKNLRNVEEELDTLLRAKKRDKINIAAAHKEYRECNKAKSRAEKALFNLLKQQEEEREALWKHCKGLERETKNLLDKIAEKAEEKRQREIEDAEMRAFLGESDVPVKAKTQDDNQNEDDAPPPTLEEILQEEITNIHDIVQIDNHLDKNFESNMRMQHEPGEVSLKVLDKTVFEEGMLLLIGEDDKIEVRGYEGEPEIILDQPMLYIHGKDTLVRAILNLDDNTRQTLESKQARIDSIHHELYGQSDDLCIDVEGSVHEDLYNPDPMLPRTPGGSPVNRPVSPGLPSLLNLDPYDFEEVLNTHERREQEKTVIEERIKNFKKDIQQKDIHIVVVGAGLAGLLAARDLASEGFYVEILEASNRLGGRIYTETFPGTSESVDMGGEWIYPHVHKTIKAECERYGLDIKQNSAPERKRYLYQRDMKRTDTKNEYMAPVPPDEEDEFARVMKQLNYDASQLKFTAGFDEPNIVLYDTSYYDYVVLSLKATKSVREFLFAMGFQFVQSDPRQYSAVNILKIISGFELEEDVGNGLMRSADDAFFLKPYRLVTGAGSLIDCIYQDLIHQYKDYVNIRFNAAVSLINLVSGRADEYEDPPFVLDEDRFNHFFMKPEIPEPVHTGVGQLTTRVDILEEETVDQRRKKEKTLRDSYHVKVVTMNGDIITGNGLIMALPLNTLNSLAFSPKVHDSIMGASKSCNVATGYKMWSIMSNISPDTDHVIRVLNEYNTLNELEYDIVQQSYVKSRKLQNAAGSKKNDIKGNVSMVAYCAIENVTDPKKLELEMKIHHPYCNVRKIITHDFCANTWSRSNGFVVKAGGYKLYAAAAKHAEFPYYPDRRISIIGADVCPVWTGFMEGAATSGRNAAVSMREFLSPRPIAYNDTGLAQGNEDYYKMYKHLLNTDGNLKENLDTLRQQYYARRKTINLDGVK